MMAVQIFLKEFNFLFVVLLVPRFLSRGRICDASATLSAVLQN